MTGAALRSVAEAFWTEVGAPEPFPRSLESSVVWALPVAVLEVRRLSVRTAEEWLRRLGAPLVLACRDRSLKGCLISYGGKGLVLVDGHDPEDERRFSLAHEVSHFLLDYLLPRRRTVERLGESVREVLDGKRRPTVEERVDALLGDVNIGVHTHLLERNPEGTIDRTEILSVESRSDLLALELLAPASEVRRRIPDLERSSGFHQVAERTADVLIDEFGLPERIAHGYGLSLCRSWFGGPSFQEWLGLR